MSQGEPVQTPAFATDEKLPHRERLRSRLAYLYGEERAGQLERRVHRLIETHKQLRERRISECCWSCGDIVLITYGDSVRSADASPLKSLQDFLSRHLKDAFSMVHVLALFPWSSDDGFSVTDYRMVDESLGDWLDIHRLREDFDLVIDLVLNHCSRENLWFIDFIAGQEPISRYFLETSPEEDLATVARPRSTPLLSDVRTYQGLRHVWSTFGNDQVDLNWSNPDVLLEFIDLTLYYLRRGARMIRFDAVAYIWKQIGSSCLNLPQTHQLVKLFRDVVGFAEPGALILTETNVPHAENVAYFGSGDEAHVVYQFSLPPLLLHALYSGNTGYLQTWAEDVTGLDMPPSCTFLNFTASHDGVGLSPLEGLLPEAELEAMLEAMRERGGFISTKHNSDRTESPYELNISYYDALGSPDDPDDRWQVPAFLLSQVVPLTLKGIPAVYINSLMAAPNDSLGVERTGRTRSINRRRWELGELEQLLADRDSHSAQVFHTYRRLLMLRRQQRALHPGSAQHILAVGDGLFGLRREAVDASQRIVALFNFTDGSRVVDESLLPGDFRQWPELLELCGYRHCPNGLELAPYGAYWFSWSDDLRGD